MDININKAALLELLAEEASELTHAALKYARILRGENPTPVTEDQAYDNIIEEFTDVMLCSKQLGIEADDDIMARKIKRWNDRLKD